MKSPVRRVLGAGLATFGLATTLALLVWRPAAPSATEPSTRATAPGNAASAGPLEVPAIPPPEGWAEVTWDEPVVQPFGPADPQLRVDGMVGTDDLLVGWGRAPMPGRNQFNDMGAIFVSRDAATWVTVPVEHGVNAVSASTVVDVAIGSDGLLAVGSVCCEPEQGAVWRSTDGLAWERLEVEGTFETGGQPDSIVALDDGWVMLVGLHVGSEVAQSADGVTWERVLEADANQVSRGIQAMTRGPDGILAIGTVEGPDESYDGVIWSSTDGRSWERVAVEDPALVGDGEVYLHDIIGHAGGYLATGVLGTAEQRRACEELGRVASLIDLPRPPREMATSCALGDEQQWASADGLSWQRVDVAGEEMRPIEFRLARAGGPGLVVLGEASGPESPDTMLFGSDDGIRWRVLSNIEPMLTDVGSGLVVRGDEVIAITEDWGADVLTYLVWRGRAG